MDGQESRLQDELENLVADRTFSFDVLSPDRLPVLDAFARKVAAPAVWCYVIRHDQLELKLESGTTQAASFLGARQSLGHPIRVRI